MVNPLPLSRDRSRGRAHTHHHPIQPYRDERGGRYRPQVRPQIARQVPDERFDELFARLVSLRDRAVLALLGIERGMGIRTESTACPVAATIRRGGRCGARTMPCSGSP